MGTFHNLKQNRKKMFLSLNKNVQTIRSSPGYDADMMEHGSFAIVMYSWHTKTKGIEEEGVGT